MPDGPTSEETLNVSGVSSEQANPEANEPIKSQPVDQSEEQRRKLQSLADQRLAEKYKAEQRAQELEERLLSIMEKTAQSPQAENPYDVATNYPAWQRWENQSLITKALEEADRRNDQKLARMIQQAQEVQWANQHPGVDIEAVKAFAKYRGISSIDDAYTLMTLPQQQQQTFTQASQSALQQFRQPEQGATTLRSGDSPPVQGKVSFQETLKQWTADPSIEERWSPEFKRQFELELKAHHQMVNRS